MNRFIGIMAASGAYFMNSLLTVSMSSNRFYSLFFPFGIRFLRRISVINWAITVSMCLVSAFSLFSARDGCACVYDPDILIWRGEISECSDMLMSYIPFFVFGTTIVTNSLNVAIIIRLLMEKMTGMNVEESKRRRKRWKIQFVQSVTQDCLQLIDIINSYYIAKLNDFLWFQFLFVTLSFLSVTAIDGFVMFVCQSDVHPKWIKRKRTGNNVLKTTISSTHFH
uniref:7TM_GPCR_Srx domain-containing protein n=1 Tax=Caenorhabditis tropicalis TaxID=1561998 RepID=A0A1I7U2E0_9PELO